MIKQELFREWYKDFAGDPFVLAITYWPMIFTCIRYVFNLTVIKHLRANILVVGLETLKMFLTLNVAMMIRVTFSLPDSLKMSARTRITALPLLTQKHCHSVFI